MGRKESRTSKREIVRKPKKVVGNRREKVGK
jgi:hypothetical protein